ncbi:MAG: GAF domain-containing protein [bacterium]
MIQRAARHASFTDVHRLRDDLAGALDETDRLRAQLEQMVATNHNLSALLLSTDVRSGELLKLLVSVRALIESRDAAAALEGLKDILVNVVGSAEFQIYALDPETDCLLPIAGIGASIEAGARLPLHASWLGDVVRAGEVLIAHAPGRSARLRDEGTAAVVPLKVIDRVLGAIVIGRVLPHREPLDVRDRDVLGLLGAYAATAIIAADRRGEWNRLPMVRK